MGRYLEQYDATPESERWRLVRAWIFNEPLPFTAELRAERPVLAMPELVLATRYADCVEILRNYTLYTVALYKPKQGPYWMAQDDTAEHWREKSVMRSLLDREDIPAIRSYVAAKTAQLLSAADGSLDAVDGLTRAVPIALVQDWFGFTDSDPKALQRWSYWNQMDAFWNQPFDSIAVADPQHVVAERERTSKELAAYLTALAARRAVEVGIETTLAARLLRAAADFVKRQLGTAKPGPTDPLARILTLSFSGALKLPVERAVLNIGGLLIGAVETTSHCVVNALDVLMQDPERLAAARAAALADDPTGFDGYIWEALRFKPAFPYFFRTASAETALSRGTPFETAVPSGRTVLALTHSGMFDETAFTTPERFDATRPFGNVFTFGMGLHECLGRAVGSVMIPEIARQALRLPNLSTGPVDRKGGPVPESWEWQWG